MRGARAGADAPLLGGFQWLPWGPPFAMRKTGGWKCNVGIQALADLTTVAEQPGEIAASALKPSHMSNSSTFYLSNIYPQHVSDGYHGYGVQIAVWVKHL